MSSVHVPSPTTAVGRVIVLILFGFLLMQIIDRYLPSPAERSEVLLETRIDSISPIQLPALLNITTHKNQRPSALEK